jgi:hypothetical protein
LAIDEALLLSILSEIERDVRTKNSAAESTACLKAHYDRILANHGKPLADVVWNFYSIARHVEMTNSTPHNSAPPSITNIIQAGSQNAAQTGNGSQQIGDVNMAQSKPRDSKAKYFLVGVACLVAALGLAAWGFSLGTLTTDQRQILLWLLPLASGFACGSFAGGISAKARGLLPGLVVAATGGFAVWLITFFVLFPNSKPDTQAAPQPAKIPAL